MPTSTTSLPLTTSNWTSASSPLRLYVFFPRTEEDHERVKHQWQGWLEAGATLFLRPNYTLNGYCMPENWARQFADEWHFCEENGMIGTDFDSLNGQWANQGPIFYLIGRLQCSPKCLQMPSLMNIMLDLALHPSR